MTITREKFIEATGREPQDDDLDRVNCDKTGQCGHDLCGWSYERNKPVFEPDDACRVCGLRMEQIAPIARYVTRDGYMVCKHWFGIPAANVPDYKTHHQDGTPYAATETPPK